MQGTAKQASKAAQKGRGGLFGTQRVGAKPQQAASTMKVKVKQGGWLQLP